MRKTVRMLALCALPYLVWVTRAGALRQAGADSSVFTLELAANLKNNHIGSWDFTNTSARVVKAGSSIQLGIRKTNQSGSEIGRIRLDGDAYGYHYELRDESGDLLAPKPPLGSENGQIVLEGPSLQRPSTIRPGEADIITVSISRYYDLSKPGKYTVQVSQPVSDSAGNAVVKSNIVVIDVAP